MKKREIVILLTICIIAVLSLVAVKLYQNSQDAIYVQVSVNGEPIYNFLLNENITKHIETDHGYNDLVVKDGYAYIVTADCADLICVHHGKIDSLGESIICLPHKLSVQIVNIID